MTEQLTTMIAMLNSASGGADLGDDTLRHYMGKSDVVLTAQLVSRKVQHGANMTTYKLVFTTHTDGIYQGHGPHGQEIHLNLVQTGDMPTGETSFPFTEGKHYILFLRKPMQANSNVWRPADPWFAVQPAYRALGEAVERLSKAGCHRLQQRHLLGRQTA